MSGPYSTIVMDCPWNEPGGCKRGADDHYDTMDRSAIIQTIVTAPCWRPAKNCHLYMWSTMTSLVDSLFVMDAIGFVYKTHGVWLKSEGRIDLVGDLQLTIGLGQYLRGVHELFLLGTRGKGFAVRTEAMNIPSVMIAPVPRENGKRVHSRKPDRFYDLVNARSLGPKLEMFSRVRREGWIGWGSEHPEDVAS